MKGLIYLVFACLTFSAFANQDQNPERLVMDIPSKELKKSDFPKFEDDLDFEHMKLAIKRQKVAFKRSGLRGDFRIGNQKMPMKVLGESLDEFEKLVDKAIKCQKRGEEKLWCLFNLNNRVSRKFRVFRPVIKETSQEPTEEARGDKDYALFTAYYSPIMRASKTKTEKMQYGIYKKPTDPVLRASTRVQINLDRVLENKGLELFWTDDLFDLYILHIEGGGLVELEENGQKKRYYLSYDGTNKQSFRFISKYMKQQGMIRNLSMKAQRNYLDANPDKWREIYGYCPSYVYFKVTQDEPLGLEDIPLTTNRSIAQDRTIYKRKGLISFVQTKRPFRENGRIVMKDFSRFYLDQDTGGAIRGEARGDLYFGYGPEAELAAHTLKQRGEIYYLIKK